MRSKLCLLSLLIGASACREVPTPSPATPSADSGDSAAPAHVATGAGAEPAPSGSDAAAGLAQTAPPGAASAADAGPAPRTGAASSPDAERENTPAAAPGAHATRAHDDVRGLSEAEVLAQWGEPVAREGTRWTYHMPPGCTDRRRVYTLRFRDGRVVDVKSVQQRTGMHCEGEF